MTVYRAFEDTVARVEALDREVTLKVGREYDDQFPEEAAIIKELGPKGRGFLRPANVGK